MKSAIALVDYDNIAPIKELNEVDQTLNIDSIVSGTVRYMRQHFPDTTELHMRIYGGWVNEEGAYSQRASWMLAQLHKFRKRLQTIVVKPEMVVALADIPHFEVRGTLRGRPARQKMVDTLMTTDLVTLAQAGRFSSIFLVSSDDDMIPGIIKSRQVAPAIMLCVLRARINATQGCNDAVLQRCGAWVHNFGEYL